ncbi:hypothetical protein D3C72_2134430 [compost metagenome]
MPLLHGIAADGALGEDVPELHQAVDGDHQQQGQPVQPDAQAAITSFRILQHAYLLLGVLVASALVLPLRPRFLHPDVVLVISMLQGLLAKTLISITF